MMPNIDPRQLKQMMERMGIKSSEIKAGRVVIEGEEKDIVIDNPQVTRINAQGNVSFQISGDIREVEKALEKAEIGDDDVRMVMESSGVGDEAKARAALEETNGDIAEAILRLKKDK
jgi:nascent polypeptide-associated complex subunit alpha